MDYAARHLDYQLVVFLQYTLCNYYDDDIQDIHLGHSCWLGKCSGIPFSAWTIFHTWGVRIPSTTGSVYHTTLYCLKKERILFRIRNSAETKLSTWAFVWILSGPQRKISACICGRPRFWNSIVNTCATFLPNICFISISFIRILFFDSNTRATKSGRSIVFLCCNKAEEISGHLDLQSLWEIYQNVDCVVW